MSLKDVKGMNARYELSQDGVITVFVMFTPQDESIVKAALTAKGLVIAGRHTFRDKVSAFMVKIDLKDVLALLEQRVANVENLVSKT